MSAGRTNAAPARGAQSVAGRQQTFGITIPQANSLQPIRSFSTPVKVAFIQVFTLGGQNSALLLPDGIEVEANGSHAMLSKDGYTLYGYYTAAMSTNCTIIVS